VAAPLLYAGPDQINLQVPFLSPFAAPAPITVTTQAGPPLTLQPPVFGSVGIFAVVNEDGSVNSASDPAADGSIVSLYLTGLGAPSSSAQDGAISPTADSAFLASIEVLWPFAPLGVLYAGTAPGLIDGLDQVNVQLPPGVNGLQLVVRTQPSSLIFETPVSSNTVTVYAQ
jgi:uncharacterized protein (TIGR03437 family)